MIRLIPILFKSCFILLALTLKVGAQTLPVEAGRSLKVLGIPPSAVGIAVQDLASLRAGFRLNAEQAMNPASVMKLVTTYAALELLGPAYRWKTQVYEDGANLVLRGTGNPKLDYEAIWGLL